MSREDGDTRSMKEVDNLPAHTVGELTSTSATSTLLDDDDRDGGGGGTLSKSPESLLVNNINRDQQRGVSEEGMILTGEEEEGGGGGGGGGEKEEEEEEDYVVKEFEVYLSQKLSQNVFVLQYPLRPKWKPYYNNYDNNAYDNEDGTTTTAAGATREAVSEVRFKPKSLKLELDFAVDTKSAFYDADNESNYSKFTLSSTSIPLRTNFAVGLIRENEIHLTPLVPPHSGVLQLRPSFAHIAVAKATDAEKEEEEDPVLGSQVLGETMEMEAETQRVQVQFKKKETERSLAAKERSHAYLTQKDEEEPWITDIQYHSRLESEGVVEQLFSSVYRDVTGFGVDRSTYLNTLVPHRERQQQQQQQQQQHQRSAQNNPPLSTPSTSVFYHSLDELRTTMSVAQQVEALLRTAHVMTFGHVVKLATNARDEIEVLQEVQRVGVVVQACWVVKSALRYEEPLLRSIRDYLLMLLGTQGWVVKKDFAARTRLPLSTAQEMISEIAVLKPNPSGLGPPRWEFKLGRDLDFEDRYHDMVQNYKAFWEQQSEALTAAMDQQLAHIDAELAEEAAHQAAAAAAAASLSSSSNLSSKRLDSARKAERPRQEVVKPQQLATPEEELRNFFKETLKKLGVATLATLESEWDQKKGQSQFQDVVTGELFMKVLESMTGNIRQGYYLSSHDDPGLDRFRDVVLKIFNTKSAIQKKDVVVGTQQWLNEETIPNTTYMKIVKELASNSKKGSWTWKTDHHSS